MLRCIGKEHGYIMMGDVYEGMVDITDFRSS
jgi:hypothetical protein